VRDGFTHYPQKRQEWRFFPGSSYFPSRIVLLDSDGSISFDVIRWLAEQQISLITINWQGEVINVIGGDTTGAIPGIRELQVIAANTEVGLQFAIQIIHRKIAHSQVTLRSLPQTATCERALSKLDNALHELQTSSHDFMALRLIEARATLAYFTVWQSMPLLWSGTARHPVPQEWLVVGQRRTMLTGTNRNASHPMNAILNYAYGVLESQIRIAATSQGFDPSIGYLHASRPGRVALVYDLMEPLRPEVDRIVLQFIRKHKFTPNDFMLTAKGVCRLHPQMARKVVSMAVDDEKVHETVEWARSTFLALTQE
jgi:CRISPR-associated endonuclease Cas1